MIINESKLWQIFLFFCLERKKVHNKEIFIMIFLYHKLTADYVTLMEKIAILTALRHISLGTF